MYEMNFEHIVLPKKEKTPSKTRSNVKRTQEQTEELPSAGVGRTQVSK